MKRSNPTRPWMLGLAIALWVVPMGLLAGLFNRNETAPFGRGNPVDPKATNYQGYVSQDRNGDGLADFTVTLNGGATNTTSPTVTITLDGATYRQALVSEYPDLRNPVTIPGQRTGTYTITSGYGAKWFYIRIEFVNGKKTPVYSNFMVYQPPYSDEAWLSAEIQCRFRQPATCATNTNLMIDLTSPYGTVQYRYGADSNTFSPWLNIAAAIPAILQNATNLATVPFLLQFKSLSGITRLVQTNFLFLDWQGFGLVLSSNSPYAKTPNVTLQVSNAATLTHMQLANSAGFTIGASSWMAVTDSLPWVLSNGPVSNLVYFRGSNLTHGLATPVLSMTTYPEPIRLGSIVINGGSNIALTPNLHIVLDVTNADYVNIYEANDTYIISYPYGTNLTHNLQQLAGWPEGSRGLKIAYSNATWGHQLIPWSWPSIQTPTLNDVSNVVNSNQVSTNSNLSVRMFAAYGDYMRLSARPDFSSGTGWIPYSSNLIYPYEGTSETNVVRLHVMVSNGPWGFTRTRTNTFQANNLVPGYFSNQLPGSLATNTNMVVYFWATNATHMRFSTNADFSTGSGWVNYSTNYLWRDVPTDTNGLKNSPWTLYAQASNFMWNQVSATYTLVTTPLSIPSPRISIASNLAFVVGPGLALWPLASNATHMRFSSNVDFSDGTGWVSYGTNYVINGPFGPQDHTNRIYGQYSNSLFGLSSDCVSNMVITRTNYFVTNNLGIVFARIPGGTYTQGDAVLSPPAQQKTVSGFSIGIAELTHSNWVLVTNWASTNGFYFSQSYPPTSLDVLKPIKGIEFYDAITFCNAFSVMEGRCPVYRYNTNGDGIYTGWAGYWGPWTNVTVLWSSNGYRLPTEAEWEYACRAGRLQWTADFRPSGNNLYAWGNNETYGIHRGQEKLPNPFVLFDIVGNVPEWCFDSYASPYPSVYVTNQINPYYQDKTSRIKVVRGGGVGSPTNELLPFARSGSSGSGSEGIRLVYIEP